MQDCADTRVGTCQAQNEMEFEVDGSLARPGTPPVVALFNASDDTVDMVQQMLDASEIHCMVNCKFSDLRKGVVDFPAYLREHDPDVVIIDISPPTSRTGSSFARFETTSPCGTGGSCSRPRTRTASTK